MRSMVEGASTVAHPSARFAATSPAAQGRRNGP